MDSQRYNMLLASLALLCAVELSFGALELDLSHRSQDALRLDGFTVQSVASAEKLNSHMHGLDHTYDVSLVVDRLSQQRRVCIASSLPLHSSIVDGSCDLFGGLLSYDKYGAGSGALSDRSSLYGINDIKSLSKTFVKSSLNIVGNNNF